MGIKFDSLNLVNHVDYMVVLPLGRMKSLLTFSLFPILFSKVCSNNDLEISGACRKALYFQTYSIAKDEQGKRTEV